jgi:hypothetical protein
LEEINGDVLEADLLAGNKKRLVAQSASTDAVKQWRYRQLTVHGKLVNRIVVVLTFDKNGKVH